MQVKSSVMFRLQLLLGLLLGIQINVINTEQQLTATAKLENASLDIKIETANDELPDDINPEGNNYVARDLLNYADAYGRSAFEKVYSSYDPDDQNPEEGDEIEGDLLMPPGNSFRSSIIKPGHIWPDGLVPYEFNGAFTQIEIEALYSAFDRYSAKTCIRFILRSNETDFVSITKPKTGCSSNVGRIGGKQHLNLAPGCYKRGTIMHEIMHILGFLHEQNSSDRDDYVKIIYENILPGREVNYKKFKAEDTSNFNVSYDYGSLMHYKANSFSKNGNPTIVPLKRIAKGVKLGQRIDFSQNDLIRINRKYHCDDKLNLDKNPRSALN